MTENDLDGPIAHPNEYLEFFRLFNERRFFDAHEVLEDLWVIEVGELRNYYKGLIMIAVAILHWQRGNLGGAARLYRDGRAYLRAYPAMTEGFALAAFREDVDRLFAALESDPANAPAPPDEAIPVLIVPI